MDEGEEVGDDGWTSRAMWPMGKKEWGGEGGVRGCALNVVAESINGSDSNG